MTPAGLEVRRGGQQRGPGTQSERRGAGREPGAFAEELHVDTVAREVAVAQEAHDSVVAQRAEHARGDVVTEGDDLEPERVALLGEPVEQLRWIDRLDH